MMDNSCCHLLLYIFLSSSWLFVLLVIVVVEIVAIINTVCSVIYLIEEFSVMTSELLFHTHLSFESALLYNVIHSITIAHN